jgi:hypothetical protein
VVLSGFPEMGKKRKSQQVVAPPATPVVEAEPPRKRTLLGLKPSQPESEAVESEVKVNGTNGSAAAAPVPFRNKEKTLVLCSRRITFRYVGRREFYWGEQVGGFFLFNSQIFGVSAIELVLNVGFFFMGCFQIPAFDDGHYGASAT